MYEEAFFALLHALHARHPSDNLALSGGCAMNSVANGKVYLNTPFKKMYLPAAAGDAGGAIGAAAMVAAGLAGTITGPDHSVRTRSLHPLIFHLRSPNFHLRISHLPPTAETSAIRNLAIRNSATGAPRSSLGQPAPTLAGTVAAGIFSPYLGPQFSNAACWSLLNPRRDQLSQAGCHLSEIADDRTLCTRTAAAIAEGKVVGWFQGRMEWGPRALGNRSILGDPRRADMKDILNAKIKRRESFRPFAPSILREHVAEWFEQDDDVPYMMEVFQIREEKRSLVPAVCHLDGSGRLQTVHHEINPLYHLLISTFYLQTGVPLVLNTSFNENEPVVCRPEEALDCFLRTKMDVLVLGNFFIERTPTAPPADTFSHRAEVDGESGTPRNSIPSAASDISRRLTEALSPDYVYLFGSYARDSAGPDSDLDFLVVVPESNKTRYQRAVEARGYLRGISFPADIIVMTRGEWERDLGAVCSLASTVKREGRLLSGR